MVREAAVRIRPLARRTPVMTSRSINERAGMEVFLKCENFQRGGAFKIRGAANQILSLTADELAIHIGFVAGELGEKNLWKTP